MIPIEQILIKKKSGLAFPIILALILIAGCTKEPGIGGSSSIKGKIYAKYYDKTFTVLNGEGYAPEKDVYIVFGDGTTYDDHVRTHYDGSYEFNYLEKGNYTIYVYSKDSTMTIPAGVYPIIAKTEIKKNHSTTQVPDITIFD